MRLKYIPCKTGYDTIIEALSDNSFRWEGTAYINEAWTPYEETFVFTGDVFGDVFELSNRIIIEAHREGTELYVSVFRGYDTEKDQWDTGTYQEVQP